MGKGRHEMKGKISDKIRSGETDADLNPERPDMEKTTNTTPHEGHQITPPNRKSPRD